MSTTARPIGVALAVLLCALTGCAGKLDDVVRVQAAQDLKCPADEVSVRDLRSRNYARDYTVTGCGQEVHYQAACNMVGSCVAYQPRDLARDETGVIASGALTAGSDDLAPAEPGLATPGEAVGADGAVAEAAVGADGAVAEPTGEPRSVQLRNECEHTVALFVGSRPRQDTGRYMTLGSMNTVTLSVRAGEPVWLLDEKGAGVTSVAVDRGSSEIVVADGCSGLSAR